MTDLRLIEIKWKEVRLTDNKWRDIRLKWREIKLTEINWIEVKQIEVMWRDPLVKTDPVFMKDLKFLTSLTTGPKTESPMIMKDLNWIDLDNNNNSIKLMKDWKNL